MIGEDQRHWQFARWNATRPGLDANRAQQPAHRLFAEPEALADRSEGLAGFIGSAGLS